MKQLMVRLMAVMSVVALMGLASPAARAQGGAPGGGMPQMSEADQKAAAEFQKKAQAIAGKYKPQLDAITKKYKPQTDAIQKKYKAQADAIQKEGMALKPEEKNGPKGQALMKKAADLNKQMMAEAPIKKMLGEIRPIAQKANTEILAAAPAKIKPMVKAQLDQQMKMMGG